MKSIQETFLTVSAVSMFIAPIVFFSAMIQPVFQINYLVVAVLSSFLFVVSGIYLNRNL